jgi:RNA polymerase sigma-70 factor (ECF subfamily)
VDEKLERERVRAALRLLTPDQRQVIVMRFLEGWSNEEIAQVLDKPVGAVKALQHRAIGTLRKLLVQKEEE